MRSLSAILLTTVLAVSGCGGGSSYSAPTAPPVNAVATKIIIYAGDLQVAPKGSALGQALCTNVLDDSGHRMHGVVVTYTVATGGGAMGDPASAPTDAAGISTSGTWTLGPGTGTQTVTASSPGVPSITFTATAN
jgi:hypothetical protein